MKKIIIAFLLVIFATVCGCSEEELIEIYDSEEHLEAQTDVKETDMDLDKTAENILSDDSRPFVVYVSGEVNKPGVYELSEGMRVIDALKAADGYTEDACEAYLNLASLVCDEQMIYVPSNEEVEQMREGEGGALLNAQNMTGNNGGNETLAVDSNGKVNINTATKEELMTLPGIGESKADKIISFRESNGRFSSIEGIMEISGIKDGLFNKIKDRISVK